MRNEFCCVFATFVTPVSLDVAFSHHLSYRERLISDHVCSAIILLSFLHNSSSIHITWTSCCFTKCNLTQENQTVKLRRFAYTFKIRGTANTSAGKSLKYYVIYYQHYLLSQAKFVFNALQTKLPVNLSPQSCWNCFAKSLLSISGPLWQTRIN